MIVGLSESLYRRWL